MIRDNPELEERRARLGWHRYKHGKNVVCWPTVKSACGKRHGVSAGVVADNQAYASTPGDSGPGLDSSLPTSSQPLDGGDSAIAIQTMTPLFCFLRALVHEFSAAARGGMGSANRQALAVRMKPRTCCRHSSKD